MTRVPLTSTVSIRDPGGVAGVNPTYLTATDIRAAWAHSRAGTLSCRIPVDRAPKADLLGMWVAWEGGPIAWWTGRITDERWGPEMVEIAAETHACQLRKRRTARTFRTDSAQRGALVKRAISDAAFDGTLWLTSVQADEDGPPVRQEQRGDDLYALVTSLAANGYEWDVTWDRRFKFGRRVGVDKRGSVLLSTGRHIVNYAWSRSLWTVVNDLLAVAGDQEYRLTQAHRVADTASIHRYGQMQATKEYDGIYSKDTLEPRARADLDILKGPASALELTVADVGSAWANVREGDRIQVVLGPAAVKLEVEIAARAVDPDAGTMRYACDVEAVYR